MNGRTKTPETAAQRAARGSSGWCLTRQHTDCHYNRFGHVCQCPCHTDPDAATAKAAAWGNGADHG
jgi:hypothetical protein